MTLANAATPKVRANIFPTLPMRDGFVDIIQAHLDSLNDLTRELKRMSEFTIVDAAEKADVVVTVLDRGVGSQAYGQLTDVVPLGKGVIAATLPITEHDYWMRVLLEVGPTYKRLFVGTASNTTRHSMGAWSDCAYAIAKDLRAWAQANSTQIRQLRTP